MNDLLVRLADDYPQLRFTAGNSFCWSPATSQVFYKAAAQSGADGDGNSKTNRTSQRKATEAAFSLLHETGHALLEHKRYRLDFELLELEVAAWQRAKQVAEQYGIVIDENHIEDCLDSYRDWLYGRSICPSCTTKTLQLDDSADYRCYNCHASWKVTASRFCRPYRQSRQIKKRPRISGTVSV